MRMLPVSAMLAIGVGLTGCACLWGRPTKEESPPCGPSISIDYAGDGTPSASPDACWVHSGDQLTWQGAPGDTRPFTIQFMQGTPDGERPRADLSSGDTGSRQTVTVHVKSVRARTDLKYGIAANGKHVDPHIIIKPN
ncbi:MAG: hypothetical protein ABIP11_06355 [Luteimonas sp.]